VGKTRKAENGAAYGGAFEYTKNKVTMKHVVSFETAKALKEAGYPQPEFETGQIWYDPNRTTFAVSPIAGRLFNLDMGSIRVAYHDSKGFFYAPSATEIIEHVGKENPGSRLYFEVGLWNAFDGWRNLSPNHENPAEAAAQLFILLNKRP
jgi:hypothetical protein